MNARPQWIQAPLRLPAPYLACERCTSVRTIGTEMCCVRANVVWPAPARPVTLVRARDGECGPDAKWQTDRAGL